jgi:hypothetical protein
MNSFTANYDESWKEALNEYFDDFLFFFFPEIYQQIDWPPHSAGYLRQKIILPRRRAKKLQNKILFMG